MSEWLADAALLARLADFSEYYASKTAHLTHMEPSQFQLTADLSNALLHIWKGVANWTKKEFPDPFGTSVQRYIGELVERYSMVKVLGMREPVPLTSLFVRANILEKISARAGLRPEELAEFFDFDRRAFGKKTETVDGEIIVNRLQKFIVLGKPGAGKTTYLKFLALRMLAPDSKIERRRLPIFVTLREWADEREPLMSFIVKQFGICGFEQAEAFVEKMLAEGQCLVLFDGLDEVSSDANQDDIIRQIRNFTDKYSQNQFVISCRVAAWNGGFERFTDVEMADFNEAQMEAFIRNWFRAEPKVAAECWQRLRSSPPLCELASVPLLLMLLCLEYSESNDFPPNRAELYERAIRTLLEKWDSSRRIRRAEVYKNLTIKRKESMFARIAFGTFMENEYFIRERTLAKMIEKYIENLPGFDPKDLEPDSHAVLRAIAAHHGIFVERAKSVYSFAHLTFQEYFTARYIVDNQWNGSLEKLVEEHLYDPKWKEVFLLVAGMLDRADELLLLMRRRANEALEVPEIDELMWVAQDSLLLRAVKYSDEMRRIFGIIIALDYALALNRTRTIALTRARALARALDLILEFGFDFDRAHVLVLGLGLDHARLEAYGRASSLNEQIVETIVEYFSANELILNCLSSGCYVSKPIREKMLHEMFLPKEDLAGGVPQDI